MLRYLLLFAALCAYLNISSSNAQAAPPAKPGKAGTPSTTDPKQKGKKVTRPGKGTKPVAAVVVSPEDDPSILPPEGKIAPGAPGPLDTSRQFQVVEDPEREVEKKTRVVTEVRTVPLEKPMAPYPDPPALSTLFGVQALPRDNEPSWIRTRRLQSMLLPPAPKRVVRVARIAPKPMPLTGKCVAIRGSNQIVLQHGTKKLSVTLFAISPATAANAKAARAGLTTLAVGKVLTVYPANKPGQTGAWVFAGKTCVNSEMLSQGWAKLSPGMPRKEAKLVSLEQAAKAGKRGIWANS